MKYFVTLFKHGLILPALLLFFIVCKAFPELKFLSEFKIYVEHVITSLGVSTSLQSVLSLCVLVLLFFSFLVFFKRRIPQFLVLFHAKKTVTEQELNDLFEGKSVTSEGERLSLAVNSERVVFSGSLFRWQFSNLAKVRLRASGQNIAFSPATIKLVSENTEMLYLKSKIVTKFVYRNFGAKEVWRLVVDFITFLLGIFVLSFY